MLLRGLCPAIATLLLAPPLAAQPALTADARTLSASGLTPGGRVVWFGVARDLDDWVPRLTHLRQEAVADAAGQAELAIPLPGSAAAVWAVADLATGTFAAARPDDPEFAVTPLPPGSWQSGQAPADRLTAARSRLDLLLVRPGTGPAAGAWRGPVGDGGPRDLEQGDGVLTAGLDDLEPVGAAPPEPPAHGAPGDLLLAIDPDTLELLALRLP